MIKKIIYGIGAVILTLGFYILGRDERKAKSAQERHDHLVKGESFREQKRAKQYAKKADDHQVGAVIAAEKTRQVIDNVDSKSIRSILDGWSDDSVRDVGAGDTDVRRSPARKKRTKRAGSTKDAGSRRRNK